jgi:hypothetical protein
MQNKFVADGFLRWRAARSFKTRKAVRERLVGTKPPANLFQRVQIWFKGELECLRGTEVDEKSSSKILW